MMASDKLLARRTAKTLHHCPCCPLLTLHLHMTGTACRNAWLPAALVLLCVPHLCKLEGDGARAVLAVLAEVFGVLDDPKHGALALTSRLTCVNSSQ